MTMQTEQEDFGETVTESATPTNKELMRMLVQMKLKLIANYILDGFAPVAAVVALIVAVMAINGNHAGQAQLGKSAASLDSLNASLTASKGEVERLRSALAQEKNLHEEDSRKQAERMAKIIQHLSQLQVKLKISPTLEEQLHQPASAAAVTAMPPVAEKKPASQAQVLTKAIEKFNSKSHK